MAEGHLGLQRMRERMKRFGGVVKVGSRPGPETTIRARVLLSECVPGRPDRTHPAPPNFTFPAASFSHRA